MERHDVHLVSCDCGVTVFAYVPCAQVNEALMKVGGGRCEQCGAIMTTRALQLRERVTRPDGNGACLTYEATLPMPVTTFLANLNAGNN